jgi:serine protease Do
MKKIIFAFLPWLFVAFSYKTMAQDVITETITNTKGDKGSKGDKGKKETQEIIIRKKGDKDVTLNVEVNGDQVLINGKPISDFKDDEITINKRKMIVRDGDRVMDLGNLNNLDFNFNTDNLNGMATMGKRTFLGVSTEKTDKGAKIFDVTKESAAAKAGLQKDDIITKVGDKKIDGPESLSDAITSMKPNDEVKVHFIRNGKDKSVKATLQETKGTPMPSFSFTSPQGGYKSFSMPYISGQDGMRKLQDLQMIGKDGASWNLFNARPKLGLKIQDTDEGTGVKVLDVEDSSAAALAGIKKDDIIIGIGDNKVTNTDEAREQLHINAGKSTYPVKVTRGGTELNFNIKIPKKLKTVNL